MASEEQLAWADRAGRYYVRQYNIPPVAGRVVGYLAVCDPPEQTIDQLAETLLASRSAIAGAVKLLEGYRAVRRERAAGDRVDRVSLAPSALEPRGFDPVVYKELAGLAREGLAVLGDAPAGRRAVLEEVAALADFLAEKMPAVFEEWRARRETLRSSRDGEEGQS
jgi:hypothetical protein